MLERCSQSGRKGSFIRKNIPARNRSVEIAFIAPQNDEKLVKVPIFLYDSGLHDESSGSWKYSVHDPEGKTSEEADREDIGRIWVGKEILGRNKRNEQTTNLLSFFSAFNFFHYVWEITFVLPDSSDRVEGASANLISPSPATLYSTIIG